MLPFRMNLCLALSFSLLFVRTEVYAQGEQVSESRTSSILLAQSIDQSQTRKSFQPDAALADSISDIPGIQLGIGSSTESVDASGSIPISADALLVNRPFAYGEMYPFREVHPDEGKKTLLEMLRRAGFAELDDEIIEIGNYDQACADATQKWRNAKDYIDVAVDPIETLVDRISEWEVRAAVAKYAQQYDEKCLKAVELDASKRGALKNLGYEDVVAFLIYDGKPICSALRISANQVVTARHCFFDPNLGTPKTEVSIENSKVVLLSQISLPNLLEVGAKVEAEVPIEDLESGPSPISITSDYIVLETSDIDASMPTGPIVLRDAVPGEPTAVTGYFQFHNSNIRFSSNEALRNALSWDQGVRVLAGGQCRVGEISVDGCIAHFCQTDQRFSGAPLVSLSAADSKLEFVGLHVSSMGEGSDEDCEFADSVDTGNIAIKISRSFLSSVP